MVIKVIALTQAHRGHGVSTAAYFLACNLADLDVPVLIISATGRNTPLHQLHAYFKKSRVVVWPPHTQAVTNIPATILQAKKEIQNKATCILLDIDINQIEQQIHGDQGSLIDYLLLASGSSDEEVQQTESAADNLSALLSTENIGIVYSRISQDQAEEIPDTTFKQQIPVLGFWPADFLLARDSDASIAPKKPHDSYLKAIGQIAQRLKRKLRLETIVHNKHL